MLGLSSPALGDRGVVTFIQSGISIVLLSSSSMSQVVLCGRGVIIRHRTYPGSIIRIIPGCLMTVAARIKQCFPKQQPKGFFLLLQLLHEVKLLQLSLLGL